MDELDVFIEDAQDEIDNTRAALRIAVQIKNEFFHSEGIFDWVIDMLEDRNRFACHTKSFVMGQKWKLEGEKQDQEEKQEALGKEWDRKVNDYYEGKEEDEE